MKKIRDERLNLKNLQHVRMTYVIQTIGIVCILGYNFIQGGVEEMRANPLWIVFMLSTVVYLYLTMSVSVEHEKEIKNPKKSFAISLIVLMIIVGAVAYLTSITPNFGWVDGLLMGAIIFICGLIPVYYVYRLRMKQAESFDDE
ncbi:hypothetical protein [Bacillus sp. FJAT-50079]|uniref:hypothetical protein n=1 Tax=Bacillus sp. FJAT-50079 TaxID=2833577 RepID=UPI001BCA535C|nr:hypothetical protein [Bacillus sp. FJAT-50079]MBS4209990.1 hypothetical protein [Bacillus sp. FJAT-50079]